MNEDLTPQSWVQHFKNGSQILLPAPGFLTEAKTQAGIRFNDICVDDWTGIDDLTPQSFEERKDEKGFATQSFEGRKDSARIKTHSSFAPSDTLRCVSVVEEWVKIDDPTDAACHKLLANVIRIQAEIEALKKTSLTLDEPYLSESSREKKARNNVVLGSLIRAGWELQAAQCRLEGKLLG